MNSSYENKIVSFDLVPCHYGFEHCMQGQEHGPITRDSYIIHYITSGKGIFKVDEKIYTLHEKQGFLICPNQVISYQADKNEPWTYCWIAFNGTKAVVYLNYAGLSSENPIFNNTLNIPFSSKIHSIINTGGISIVSEMTRLSLLYDILTCLVEIGLHNNKPILFYSKEKNYIDLTLAYIHSKYPENISVASIANHLGLNSSYLGTIFKKITSQSLQQYIISYRMQKACNLLSDSHLTIGSVARSVGYINQFQFSKMFKNSTGLSPSDYRLKINV